MKRKRTLREEGRYLQATAAHAQAVAKRLGLEKAKPSPTPEVESLRPEAAEDDLDELPADQAKEYRSLTCTLL